MNFQHVPLEGHGVSPLKVTAMLASPLVFLWVHKFSKAVVWGACYVIWLFACMYLQYDNPRLETLGYCAMFVMTYVTFYNLVYAGSFKKEYFHKLLRYFLWTYIIVIVLQQAISVALRTEVPFLNFYYVPLELLKVPGLTQEPSSSSRIMGAMFLAFLQTSEFIENKPITPVYLWKNYRWLTLGFLYAMISMYSGTAMVVLAILAVYFFRGKQLFYVVPLCLLAWILIPQVKYNPLTRVVNTTDAALTLVSEEVIIADHSASFRVVPILNVLKADYSDAKTWLGYGTDTSDGYDMRDDRNTVFAARGLICFVIGLFFVFNCAIKPLFSVATLLFLAVVGSALLNFYYTWGILMIFTVVSYFYIENQKNGDTLYEL